MENDFKIIEKLELELSSSEVRKDEDRLSQLLADDFEEFGKSGNVFNKADTLSALTNEEYQEISFSDFRFIGLSDDTVLVKYKSRCNDVKALRSSVWVKNNGNWQMLHHQGTAYE